MSCKSCSWISFPSIIYLVLAAFLLLSCNSKPKHRSEIIRVFSVKEVDDEYVPGVLLYKDSIVYQTAYLPLKKFVFDKNNILSGIEAYPIVKSKETEVISEYKSPDGQILSRYESHLNKHLQKSNIRAYDASTNDLLRVEELEYNASNLLSTRKIFTSDSKLATSYSLLYDAYGNETKKVTQHLLSDTIITEELKITKYDDENRWQEKWGFIQNKPVAYYQRTIIE